MPPTLRSAKKSSNGKASFEIVEWEDDPNKRKQNKAEFEGLKQYYRLYTIIAIEACTEAYGKLKLTYNNSKEAFDQKGLIEDMNEIINEIVEHSSRIDGLLKSDITSFGHYDTVAPTRGECWESDVWASKEDICNLQHYSGCLFEKMKKFYERVKRSEFPSDFDECVRSFRHLLLLGKISPYDLPYHDY